jgi:hypothetical protein
LPQLYDAEFLLSALASARLGSDNHHDILSIIVARINTAVHHHAGSKDQNYIEKALDVLYALCTLLLLPLVSLL